MKKKESIFVLSWMLLALFFNFSASAQSDAFHKGALLVSATEGQTWANYATGNETDGSHGFINGVRDPLSLEYGLSKRWGIGLTSGADLYMVDPSRFYAFNFPGGKVKATTSEITVDGHYHLFVTRKADISLLTSIGGFSVSTKGSLGDYSYKYSAGGNIIRIGSSARYYFLKRLGALATFSTFASQASTKGVKDNTVANNYTTSICGFALEFGLCFRFF